MASPRALSVHNVGGEHRIGVGGTSTAATCVLTARVPVASTTTAPEPTTSTAATTRDRTTTSTPALPC